MNKMKKELIIDVVVITMIILTGLMVLGVVGNTDSSNVYSLKSSHIEMLVNPLDF